MHDTTIKHRYAWATNEDYWWVECLTCDWVSPEQPSVERARELDAEHLDAADAER